jgi:hypothetical protein
MIIWFMFSILTYLFIGFIWYKIGYMKGRNDLVKDFMELWNKKTSMQWNKHPTKGFVVEEIIK